MKKQAKKNSDIFGLIKADHEKVSDLFGRLEKTTERGGRTRSKLYAELRFNLSAHAEAEEKAIYPSLKEEKGTEEIGFESVEEHGLMKFLLRKLDETSPESKEWAAQITALKEVVEHHVKEEEHEMFKQMKRTFSAQELDAFAEGFLEVKASLQAASDEGQEAA